MSTLTVRLPDGTHARLKQMAKARGVSINKLVEEMATATLAAHDAEMRFRLLAARGSPKRALALLNRLDDDDRHRPRSPRRRAA
ncbi:toxin-antitoxin system HicB family antitoxin [Vineibacter terrae]|uniref:toxin-antitoxin system HicB family antitoxin n=1 Tax=Vineibacter terrae TaxID=2586908 RepID=UPI002E3773C3|nr:toxin-antitoxin system HicB family antitoxin [Vineibacter terrae]HEX2888890.1 toxin-antitoxin system HicB family antitoxin [Vineibacter terrae]